MTVSSQHLFWITSDAAGTVALVLSSAAVGFGLTLGGKLIKRRGADRFNIHEILSLSVMVAVAVHGLSLLGDKWLHPSLIDVTLPFASSYKTLPTAIGIIAGWGLIFLGLSYYLRKRIGMQRWRLIHRFTLLAWALGLIHAFTEGSDAGKLWFVALIALTAAPAVVALAFRVRKHALSKPPGGGAQTGGPPGTTAEPMPLAIGYVEPRVTAGAR